MAELAIGGAFVEPEAGFFDDTGRAKSFFYYRVFDQASDIFLDSVGMGERARREINRSNYSATAEIEVMEPVSEDTELRFTIAVDRIGGKSVTYHVNMLGAQDGALLAVYKTVGVCMDMTGPTPMTIPGEVRDALAPYTTE